jgi:hypothetical protein
MGKTDIFQRKEASMGLEDCRWVTLPKIGDERGNLCIVENHSIPFAVSRIFYAYDIPASAVRGGHAHFQCEQLIIAVHGTFEVTLTDGAETRQFGLSDPAVGLYVAPMTWCTLQEFSTGSVCLVLASMPYREEDYCRSFEDFLQSKEAS